MVLSLYSILIFLISFSFSLMAHTPYEYHVVIDGGGSSSRLQILDADGCPLLLKKMASEGKEEVVGECMNINTVGVEGITAVFHELFDDLNIGSADYRSFESIIPNSTLTLGLAGMGLKETQNKVERILEEFGFIKKQLNLYTDVGLALELVKSVGGVLISGTGSICFAKEKDKIFRSGGLGRVLGDEGSGYQIGLNAIKKSLEQEYGWGVESTIYSQIKDFFGCERLGSVIRSIHSGDISPKMIASLTPMVFEAAHNGDFVCAQIIDHAANELGKVAAHALKRLEEPNPIVYLIGGIFKNKYAKSFINKISVSPHIQQLGKTPLFVNISEINYASEVVREQILTLKDPDKFLHSLPFVKADFKDFSLTYNLKNLTTEAFNKTTRMLGETFHKNKLHAINLLHQADSQIIQGMHAFYQEYDRSFSNALYQCIKNGGKVFFIGSGSSGRVAVDLEAKWNAIQDLIPNCKGEKS